jgi:hypothetical protein
MKVIIKPYPKRFSVRGLRYATAKVLYKRHYWQLTAAEENSVPFRLIDGLEVLLDITANKLLDLRKQRISVRIDSHDVWNLDSTLAHIIVPALKKYLEETHSYGYVDNEDVPESLRVENKFSPEERLGVTRWEYVIREMIFAFETILEDEDIFEDKSTVLNRQENGLRLFAKYYRGLWS